MKGSCLRDRGPVLGLTLGLLVMLGGWIGCRSAPPGTPSMQVLHDAERKGDVMRFAGGAPDRCSWSAPGEEVCTWRLSNRHRAWWAIAPTLPTDYQVNLVCAFPTDGSPRDPDACVGYPRKFMPFGSLPPVSTRGGARKGAGVSPTDRVAHEKSHRAEARDRLAQAGTVWEMTSLVGNGPEHCGLVDERNQYCTWRLGRRSLGYEVFALLADTDGWVELDCTFPRDGSPRGPGSCQTREIR